MAAPFDIEQLRVDFERTTHERLRQRGVLVPHVEVPFVSPRERAVTAESVLESVREVDAALGCTDSTMLVRARSRDVPIEVLHPAQPRVFAVDEETLALVPGTLRRLLLGWWVGHALAHLAHPLYREAWAAAQHGSTRTSVYAYARAAAITADRCALVAGRDVTSLCGWIAASDEPLPTLFDRCGRLVDAHLLTDSCDSSHIEEEIRCLAVWRFADTWEYAQLVGGKPTVPRIHEIDAWLLRLLDPERTLHPDTFTGRRGHR